MNFDVEAIKRKMLVKYPFFGSVVANVDYKENSNVPTAGTDGEIIHYNPQFLEKLNVEEQTFIFAHEVCHIAFDHILRSEGKDPIIWNIATDAVINAFLRRDGLKMVEGGVDIADAINYDAEQLYEKLLKEKQQQQQNENDNSQGNNSQSQSSEGQNNGGSSSGDESEQSEQKSSQGGGNSSSDTESQKKQNNQSSGSGEQTSDEEKQDVGHDTHSMWDEAIKKHKEKQKQQQSGQGNSGEQGQNDNNSSQGSNSRSQSSDEKNNGNSSGSEDVDPKEQKSSQSGESSSSDSNSQKEQNNNSSGSGEQNVGHDTHSMWDEAIKKHKEKQKQQQSGQGNSGEQGQNDNNSSQGSNSQFQSSDEKNNGNSSSSEDVDQKEQKSSQSGESSSSDSNSQKEQNNNSSGSGEQNSDKEKEDVGHDTHSMWDEAIKKHKEKQLKKTEKEVQKNEIEKKQEEIDQLGEKESFKKNLEEKKKILEELKKALSKQVMGAGSSTNRDVISITDIGKSKPLIDWRYVLKEAIKYDVDWSYRNATIEDGVISANLEEQPMPETEIVLDTSGSINKTLLKNFLRECKNILQHSRLKVGCFDTEFYGFHEIRTEEDIENMTFVGGGGTDFNVAVGAFSRRVENKIIFTDGDAYMPNMPLDAIWIVFGGIRINPKGGKVIQIDDEQLNRLCSYQQDNSYNRRIR